MPLRGLGGIQVGGGVDVQRVVLAFAGAMVTSASTFIFTRCLPRSMADRPISAPTEGMPVASMITSISPDSSRVSTLEVVAIRPHSITAFSSSVVFEARARSGSP